MLLPEAQGIHGEFENSQGMKMQSKSYKQMEGGREWDCDAFLFDPVNSPQYEMSQVRQDSPNVFGLADRWGSA